MTLSDLKQALKADKIPELLLLYGEEAYFVEETVQLVCDAAVAPENRDFNLNHFLGRDFKPSELIEQALTFPVFAPHRLILLKDVHEASADQLEILIPYLENPVSETILLVTGNKIDTRRKFFKKFKQLGVVLEFRRIYDNQLPALVRDIARDLGVNFTGAALQLFCKRVGTNMIETRGELEKLISYLGERTLVEAEDVSAIVSDTRIESVFDLTDALGEGNRGEALRLLNRLLDEGQAPLMVLAMLTRHFRQLWKAQELTARETPHKELSRIVGISPYFLKGLIRQSGFYSTEDYRRIFDQFLETDLALKSSGGEPRMLLESLIASICGYGRGELERVSRT
ncbi:MAG: DNA polymerase III subunit delta [Desulfuromonadales bacterium]|nr:DNA polymerase III subunit delta [Desulfuromonadales bacterium]